MSEVTTDQLRAVRKGFEKQEYSVYLEDVPDSPDTPSSLIIFGDGEYLLRENPIGRFFRKISTKETPSLKDGPDPSFSFSLPKIDPAILQKQVSFYREVMKKYSNSEAYTLILWDKVESKYIVICPEQQVSGATVKYQLDMEEYPSSRYIQVVSCHSHNSMNAFFSGTDDNDEQADMLYMVFGKLDTPEPEFKIRANLKGKEICKLNLEDIFSISLEEYSNLVRYWFGTKHFPEDWLNNVVVLKRSLHSLRNFGSKYGKVPTWLKSSRSYGGRMNPIGAQQNFSFFKGTPDMDYGAHDDNSKRHDELILLNDLIREFLLDLNVQPVAEALESFICQLIDTEFEVPVLEAVEVSGYGLYGKDEASNSGETAEENISTLSSDFHRVNSYLSQVDHDPILPDSSNLDDRYIEEFEAYRKSLSTDPFQED